MLASQHCSEVICCYWYHQQGWTGSYETLTRFSSYTYTCLSCDNLSSESLLQSIRSWVWQLCLQIRGGQCRLQWGWLCDKQWDRGNAGELLIHELLKNTATCAYSESTPSYTCFSISLFDLKLPLLTSCQHFPSTCTLCPQSRALAFTSVRKNTWSMLWQSVCIHTPRMSSLCGCTLALLFQDNTISPLMHASRTFYTNDCLTVHCISSYSVPSMP